MGLTVWVVAVHAKWIDDDSSKDGGYWSSLICKQIPDISSLAGQMIDFPHYMSRGARQRDWLIGKRRLGPPPTRRSNLVAPKKSSAILKAISKTLNFISIFTSNQGYSGPLGMLASCRQLYPEAQELFYATSTFSFNDHISWVSIGNISCLICPPIPVEPVSGDSTLTTVL